jgi:hypothetical protein
MGTIVIIAVLVSALFGCWVLFLNLGDPVRPIQIHHEKQAHQPDWPQEPLRGARLASVTQPLPDTVDAG